MPCTVKRIAPDVDMLFLAIVSQAHTLGALECLAGVGTSQDDRAAFWRAFMRFPGEEALNRGAAVLKDRIRSRLTAATKLEEAQVAVGVQTKALVPSHEKGGSTSTGLKN